MSKLMRTVGLTVPLAGLLALCLSAGAQTLDEAIASYRRRERRFGQTSEQVRERARAVTPVPDSVTAASATRVDA